jgi:cytochrome c oxidase subunit 3
MASAKLGMWVFLATEILMFGGLFCAYSVYRHNHPEVFEFAHQYLDKTLGAINTLVLITSSLTMAWGVRLAQLGNQRSLILCLILTIFGGYVFLGIKSVEYRTKWEHKLGMGQYNRYDARHQASGETAEHEGALKNQASGGGPIESGGAEHPAKPGTQPPGAPNPSPASTKPAAAAGVYPGYFDPNAGTPDAAHIVPVAPPPAVLAPEVTEEHRKGHASEEELESEYDRLNKLDQERTSTFFQIYFLMTGLHGIHVVVGMALIFWVLVRAVPMTARRTVLLSGLASAGLFFIYVGILVRHNPTWIIGVILLLLAAFGIALRVMKPQPALAAAPAGAALPLGYHGSFGPDYFTPVDIVGLYWHLVDLIWIFLFPLLYLIH